MRPENRILNFIGKVFTILILAYLFYSVLMLAGKAAQRTDKMEQLGQKVDEVQKKHLRIQPPADIQERIKNFVRK